MMGIQETPARLFYDFCLEEHVPVDHVLRGIDRHLALDDLRQSLKPFYSQMGRPSVDPELMIQVLILGYSMGIRSERRLCEEVHLNLAYRWFCRLGLDGRVPDHSTFSEEQTRALSRERRALRRHPAFRERGATLHCRGPGQRRRVCGRRQLDCGRRQQTAVGCKPQGGSPKRSRKPRPAPHRSTLPLSTTRRSGVRASPLPPKFISRSDPAAQWTGAHKGHAFFAYASQHLINPAITAIRRCRNHTRAIRQAEVGAARTMLERTETRFGIKPACHSWPPTAPTARRTALHISSSRRRKSLRVPVFDKSNRTDGTFSRVDFTNLTPRTATVTPVRRARELVQFRRAYATPRSGITAAGRHGSISASKLDCGVCRLKAQCCPNDVARKIPRDLRMKRRPATWPARTPQLRRYAEACRRAEESRDAVRTSQADIPRLTRLRLRGPNGANDEFLLAATAQNLRRLAQLKADPIGFRKCWPHNRPACRPKSRPKRTFRPFPKHCQLPIRQNT